MSLCFPPLNCPSESHAVLTVLLRRGQLVKTIGVTPFCLESQMSDPPTADPRLVSNALAGPLERSMCERERGGPEGPCGLVLIPGLITKGGCPEDRISFCWATWRCLHRGAIHQTVVKCRRCEGRISQCAPLNPSQLSPPRAHGRLSRVSHLVVAPALKGKWCVLSRLGRRAPLQDPPEFPFPSATVTGASHAVTPCITE